jgi:hypothetical protein
MKLAALALLPLCACLDSGSGTEKFTTWGEEFVESGIPAGDGTSGFVDGWALKYSKFIVNFHNITVADAAGKVVGHQTMPAFVDNTKIGVKDLITFPDLDAKSYSQVSYEIKPAVAGATVVAGDPTDLQLMIENGWSFYAAGSATKGAVVKTFKWGFKTQTTYHDCHSAPENGISTEGIVITNNQTDESQLTTHGDHLFYDSLQAGDNAKPTYIRFEEKAAADTNNDGEITLQELCQAHIDPSLYNTSGLPGATIGDFVISLARTIGHFRHEGECTIRRLDPPPTGVVNPCDEYR